jgi:hypothetical protein
MVQLSRESRTVAKSRPRIALEQIQGDPHVLVEFWRWQNVQVDRTNEHRPVAATAEVDA